MRIAFSGAQNTGKSTLVKDFLTCWPQYKTLDKSYRDVIKENKLTHSSNTTQETQRLIRDWMYGEIKKNKKGDKIVYDRCLLDNLIYTLWAYRYHPGSIDGKFVDETIDMVKESMRNIDIIFYIPADKCDFGIVDDEFRDVSIIYRDQIDQIFKGIIDQFKTNFDADVFWPKNDSPCVIDVYGSRENRLLTIGDYVSESGDPYGEEHSIFSGEQLDIMEQLLKEQKNQKTHDDEIIKITDEIKNSREF